MRPYPASFADSEHARAVVLPPPGARSRCTTAETTVSSVRLVNIQPNVHTTQCDTLSALGVTRARLPDVCMGCGDSSGVHEKDFPGYGHSNKSEMSSMQQLDQYISLPVNKNYARLSASRPCPHCACGRCVCFTKTPGLAPLACAVLARANSGAALQAIA